MERIASGTDGIDIDKETVDFGPNHDGRNRSRRCC